MKQLTSKTFATHLHTIFSVEIPETLELELTEVTDSSNAAVEQFSVTFKGPAPLMLQQGTYTLHHPQMKQLTLFLVPLGQRDGRTTYEAIFTRLVDAAKPAPVAN